MILSFLLGAAAMALAMAVLVVWIIPAAGRLFMRWVDQSI